MRALYRIDQTKRLVCEVNTTMKLTRPHCEVFRVPHCLNSQFHSRSLLKAIHSKYVLLFPYGVIIKECS